MDLSHHHAYLLLGRPEAVIERLPALLSGFTPTIWQTDSWQIENSRLVKEWQLLRPAVGEIKVGVIVCRHMTPAAGHALLKVLEEPAAGVKFFLIIPHEGVLLPTLHSRLVRLDLDLGPRSASLLADEFLAASLPTRLEKISSLPEPEKLPAELEEWLIKFKSSLSPKAFVEMGETVRLAAKRLANDRLPAKFVLETMALTLPRVVL